MSNGKENDDNLFKSKFYFKLGDAVDDVKFAFGAKETATESAKLVGKTASNIAIFSGKLGLKIIKEMPNTLANMAETQLKTQKNLSDEQRAKLESMASKRKK